MTTEQPTTPATSQPPAAARAGAAPADRPACAADAPPPEGVLWVAADVARHLRLSTSWVAHAAADGRIPRACIVRVPGARALRFNPEAVRAWAHGRLPADPPVVVAIRPKAS